MSAQKEARAQLILNGTVKSLNFAPKGEVDGLILAVAGEVIQVNIPPDRAEQARDLVGKSVELEVGLEPKVAEHPKGEHIVHKLIAFAGEKKDDHPAPKPPGHKPPQHAHDKGEHVDVRGKVERINFAKHGEANGVVLDSGDFVHLKPDGMKKVGLEVGQEVVARGHARSTPTGGRAVEAEVVNGTEVGHKKPH